MKNVHLLIAAGYGGQKYKNAPIGRITLGFGDAGPYIVTDLILGWNIRDWSVGRTDVVNTFESQTLREGIRSGSSGGSQGRIDILTIDVPRHLTQAQLTKIQIDDLQYSYYDPCILVWGVTVQSS